MPDTWIMKLIAFLLSFVAMEATAWFAHKYVMHGILWRLHDDHHYKEQYGFFEKNDFFFLVFAIPGIALLLAGFKTFNLYFWIGMGITAYGLAYFFVHDVFIHQRIKWLKKSNNSYLRAIRKAHKIHHSHLEKENGECFGMLWVPAKYYREAKRTKR